MLSSKNEYLARKTQEILLPELFCLYVGTSYDFTWGHNCHSNTVNSFIMSQRSQFVIFASDGEQILIQANVPSLQMQDSFKCNKFIVFE